MLIIQYFKCLLFDWSLDLACLEGVTGCGRSIENDHYAVLKTPSVGLFSSSCTFLEGVLEVLDAGDHETSEGIGSVRRRGGTFVGGLSDAGGY